MIECNTNRLEFHGLGRREVVAQFDGGPITSDAGGLLLRDHFYHRIIFPTMRRGRVVHLTGRGLDGEIRNLC